MENYLDQLPENVINKIFLYSSHPVADLLKQNESYRTNHDDQIDVMYEGSISFIDVYFIPFYCSHCGESNVDCKYKRIDL